MAAGLATITKTGTPTRVAATQLRQVVVELLKPSEGMSRALAHMGLESGKAAIEAFGLQGTLAQLETVAAELGMEFAEVFGSVEAFQGVLALTGGNAATAAADLREIKGATGETTAAYDIMADSAEQAVREAEAAFAEAKLEFGEVILPIKTDLMRQLTEIFGDIAEEMEGVDNPGEALGIIIGEGIAAGIGLAIEAAPDIIISSIEGAIKGVGIGGILGAAGGFLLGGPWGAAAGAGAGMMAQRAISNTFGGRETVDLDTFQNPEGPGRVSRADFARIINRNYGPGSTERQLYEQYVADFANQGAPRMVDDPNLSIERRREAFLAGETASVSSAAGTPMSFEAWMNLRFQEQARQRLLGESGGTYAGLGAARESLQFGVAVNRARGLDENLGLPQQEIFAELLDPGEKLAEIIELVGEKELQTALESRGLMGVMLMLNDAISEQGGHLTDLFQGQMAAGYATAFFASEVAAANRDVRTTTDRIKSAEEAYLELAKIWGEDPRVLKLRIEVESIEDQIEKLERKEATVGLTADEQQMLEFYRKLRGEKIALIAELTLTEEQKQTIEASKHGIFATLLGEGWDKPIAQAGADSADKFIASFVDAHDLTPEQATEMFASFATTVIDAASLENDKVGKKFVEWAKANGISYGSETSKELETWIKTNFGKNAATAFEAGLAYEDIKTKFQESGKTGAQEFAKFFDQWIKDNPLSSEATIKVNYEYISNLPPGTFIGENVRALIDPTHPDYPGTPPPASTTTTTDDTQYFKVVGPNGKILPGAVMMDRASADFLAGANPGAQVVAMAQGGIVMSPTMALLGEAGPEAVIPLQSFNRTGFSQGGGEVPPIDLTLTLDGNVLFREIIRAGERVGVLGEGVLTARI